MNFPVNPTNICQEMDLRTGVTQHYLVLQLPDGSSIRAGLTEAQLQCVINAVAENLSQAGEPPLPSPTEEPMASFETYPMGTSDGASVHVFGESPESPLEETYGPAHPSPPPTPAAPRGSHTRTRTTNKQAGRKVTRETRVMADDMGNPIIPGVPEESMNGNAPCTVEDEDGAPQL